MGPIACNLPFPFIYPGRWKEWQLDLFPGSPPEQRSGVQQCRDHRQQCSTAASVSFTGALLMSCPLCGRPTSDVAVVTRDVHFRQKRQRVIAQKADSHVTSGAFAQLAPAAAPRHQTDVPPKSFFSRKISRIWFIMPDMFCYMSVCKSPVANFGVQATRDVYFREHGGWIVMWFVFANQHLPIQVNGKIE